jgi:hypothetical protein
MLPPYERRAGGGHGGKEEPAPQRPAEGAALDDRDGQQPGGEGEQGDACQVEAGAGR